MPPKDLVAFAVVGSVPIHESDPVNELAEIQMVRLRDAGRSKRNGGSVIRIISLRAGFWIVRKKIERPNRSGYRRL
jgi:hypothetical protein